MKSWRHAREQWSVLRARGMERRHAARRWAAERPRYFLAREITLVLAVKCLALSAIWWTWFAHPESRAVDAARMNGLLYDAAQPSAPAEGSSSNAQR